MILTISRSTGQIFCRMILSCGCFCCCFLHLFSCLDLVYIFCGGRPQGSFLTPSYQSADSQPDLSLLMLAMTTWHRSCLSGFSTMKLLLFPIFHTVLFKRSHYAQPNLRSAPVYFTSLRAEYL